MRLTPTLTRQCWLFAVGSALFAAATAPGFSATAGAGATNLLCFAGSWFFNVGTFVGALCFLVAALRALPRFHKPSAALRQSPA